MKNLLFIAFGFLLLMTSCVKDDPPGKIDNPDVSDRKDAQVLKDVSYGTAKMDIYLPANRSTNNTKVLILLHGGAWATGDKNGGDDDDPHFLRTLDSFKSRLSDWAIFNVNYRLANVTGKNKFPAQEDDIKNAVQYIFSRKSEFAISDKWVYAGLSAGAQLVMLQGYKYNTPVKPKAIIDFYGPVDMTALYNWSDALTQSGLRILLNGTPSNNATLYTSSSPITFVTKDSPPTIILQGGADDTVPEAQGLALRDKLKSMGVTCEYADYLQGETHGWSSADIWTKCFNSIQNFLQTNVP